ncbi:MAG: hypothetical protein AB6733_19505 [Clostridiaceae bacterium]
MANGECICFSQMVKGLLRKGTFGEWKLLNIHQIALQFNVVYFVRGYDIIKLRYISKIQQFCFSEGIPNLLVKASLTCYLFSDA